MTDVSPQFRQLAFLDPLTPVLCHVTAILGGKTCCLRSYATEDPMLVCTRGLYVSTTFFDYYYNNR